jgi:hypothetical protein
MAHNQILTEKRRRQVSYLMATLHKPSIRRVTEALAGLDPPITASKSTVHRDMAVVRNEWKNDRLRNMDEVIGEELSKLSLMEEQAWHALAQSKQPAVKTKTVTKEVPFGDDGGVMMSTTTTHEQVQRVADPRQLRALTDILERRAKLLGLDQPKSLDLTSGGEAIPFTCDPGFGDWQPPEFTPEQKGDIETLRKEVEQIKTE